MIRSFGHRLADDLFNDRSSAEVRQFPAELCRVAQRKLQYLNAAGRLQDLRTPPGNRLESLRGARKGFYSVRINEQWRLIFKWKDGAATDVQIVDYH